MPSSAVSGVWSFNHRLRARCVSDSDDSEVDPEVDAPSDDARLLREIDLSTRPETVEYRSNPWSIAKINASIRQPATRNQNTGVHRTPSRRPVGRIEEAFKKQVEHNAYQRQRRVVCDGDDGNNRTHKLVPPGGDSPASETRKNQAPDSDDDESKDLSPRKCTTAASESDTPLERPGLLVPQEGLVRADRRPPVHHDGESHPLTGQFRPFGTQPTKVAENAAMPPWLGDVVVEQITSYPTPMVSEPKFPSPESPSPSGKIQYMTQKRVASPGPARLAKKPRIRMTRTSTKILSAYDFGQGGDSDADWKTFQHSGKATKYGVGGRKQSGWFRLPVPRRMTTRSATKEAPQVKSRIITYLPPPRTAGQLSHDLKQGRVRNDVKMAKNLATETVSMEDIGSIVAFAQEDGDDGHTIAVPDSDGMTLVGEDDECVISFELDDVCKHYATTRAMMKEVRLLTG
ncbi:hypothetical protein F5I97DRAFT_1816118 [Phlebopus sp. FC_14]|nr:hypothetical protein F5I97DRAFT_1816118 [Phlebopus sp. FC_14]